MSKLKGRVRRDTPRELTPERAKAKPATTARLSPAWYGALALAVVAIGVLTFVAVRHGGEGQIEIRERDGLPDPGPETGKVSAFLVWNA